MDISKYWSLPRSGQGSQDEIIKAATPPYEPRCVLKVIDVRKAIEGVNPCLALYGYGPDGKECRECSHMRYVQYSKKYWKCDLRENTHGAATDHRRRWPACGRFEQIA